MIYRYPLMPTISHLSLSSLKIIKTNSMKYLFLIGAICLNVILTSCSGSKEEVNTNIDQSNWKTLSEADFSLKYPADWELDQTGSNNTRFFLKSKVTEMTDDFRENINLLNEDLGGAEISLDEYMELSMENLHRGMPGLNITKNEKMTVKGQEYYQLEYYVSQGGMDLSFEQRFTIANGMVYVLTFSAKKDDLKKFKSIAENIMDSFELK